MTASLPRVIAVSRAVGHAFSKVADPDGIVLLKGLGVEGDAHCGKAVKHRSRVAVDPDQPNLRQVHLIHAELLDELAARGFAVSAGDLGENILTRGIDLLGLATGTRLQMGSAEMIVTGLRNPCAQIDRFRAGLLSAVVERAADGSLVRKCGVMGIVAKGGLVRPGDMIRATAPAGKPVPLAPV